MVVATAQRWTWPGNFYNLPNIVSISYACFILQGFKVALEQVQKDLLPLEKLLPAGHHVSTGKE